MLRLVKNEYYVCNVGRTAIFGPFHLEGAKKFKEDIHAVAVRLHDNKSMWDVMHESGIQHLLRNSEIVA